MSRPTAMLVGVTVRHCLSISSRSRQRSSPSHLPSTLWLTAGSAIARKSTAAAVAAKEDNEEDSDAQRSAALANGRKDYRAMERQTSKAARRTPSRDQRIEQPSVEDAPTVDKLSWKKHSRTTPSVADHYCLENASIDALPADTEERKVALMTVRALRSGSETIDAISPQHVESIFSQLYSSDTLTKSPKSTSTSQHKTSTTSLPHALSLLSHLQSHRRPRTSNMYHTVLRHCMTSGKPDLAAAVFVGLVEEWILEGRLAEVGKAVGGSFGEGEGSGWKRITGGDVAAAAGSVEGGGKENSRKNHQIAPKPGNTHTTSDLSLPTPRTKPLQSIIDGWFEGVRNWRLIGETLAPMEKLKLWHPKALRLQEKMKNFPLPSPTSPPSLVPPPDAEMLDVIVRGLTTRPAAGGNVNANGMDNNNKAYRRSTRALAILSNTILSRTLPITALKPLLSAMKGQSLAIPVFPKNLDISSIPHAHLSEYTAGTQIHSALVSLIWSPPSTNRIGSWAAYRLQPLSLTSLDVLVKYALSSIPRMDVLKPFLRYTKNLFGMGVIAKAQVGKTVTTGFFSRFALQGPPRLGPAAEDAPALLAVEGPVGAMKFSEEGLIYDIKMAGAKRQTEKLQALIRQAFPILAAEKEAGARESEETRMKARRVKRTISTSRSGWMYTVVLEALAVCRLPAMAEMIYALALRGEVLAGGKWFLPIEAHNQMLALCEREHRVSFDDPAPSLKVEDRIVKGLYVNSGVPRSLERDTVTRDRAAWHTACTAFSVVTRNARGIRANTVDQQRYDRSVKAFDHSLSEPCRPDVRTLHPLLAMLQREVGRFVKGGEERSWKFGYHLWRMARRLQSTSARFGVNQGNIQAELAVLRNELMQQWEVDKKKITKSG